MPVTVETRCCGKEMLSLGQVDFLDQSAYSVRRWLCPECGCGIDLVQYLLEEDDLANQVSLYVPAEDAGGAA